MHARYIKDRYQIFHEMNHGRYAIVYKAEDKRNGKMVAIKVINKHVLREKEMSNEYLVNEKRVFKILCKIDRYQRRSLEGKNDSDEESDIKINDQRSISANNQIMDSESGVVNKIDKNMGGDNKLESKCCCEGCDKGTNEQSEYSHTNTEENVGNRYEVNEKAKECCNAKNKEISDRTLKQNTASNMRNSSHNYAYNGMYDECDECERAENGKKDYNYETLDLDNDTSGRNNVIRFYDYYVCNDFNEYIIMELIDGYDLQREVHERFHVKNRVQYTFKERIDIMLNLIKGVEYLHSKNIYHFDLKPENIMLMDSRVVIVDFGCAFYSKRGREKANKFFMKGTPGFCPPEISDMEVLDREVDLAKIDVWAMCCSFYYLFEGKLPFRDENFNDMRFNEVIIALRYDKDCSDEVLRICEKVFIDEPMYRLTLEEFKEEIVNMADPCANV